MGVFLWAMYPCTESARLSQQPYGGLSSRLAGFRRHPTSSVSVDDSLPVLLYTIHDPPLLPPPALTTCQTAHHWAGLPSSADFFAVLPKCTPHGRSLPVARHSATHALFQTHRARSQAPTHSKLAGSTHSDACQAPRAERAVRRLHGMPHSGAQACHGRTN